MVISHTHCYRRDGHIMGILWAKYGHIPGTRHWSRSRNMGKIWAKYGHIPTHLGNPCDGRDEYGHNIAKLLPYPRRNMDIILSFFAPEMIWPNYGHPVFRYGHFWGVLARYNMAILWPYRCARQAPAGRWYVHISFAISDFIWTWYCHIATLPPGWLLLPGMRGDIGIIFAYYCHIKYCVSLRDVVRSSSFSSLLGVV